MRKLEGFLHMHTALFIGSAFGAFVGIAHAGAIFLTQRSRASRHSKTQHKVNVPTLYYCVWAVMLWMLFGSYVLYLWVVASVVFLGHVSCQRLQSSHR